LRGMPPAQHTLKLSKESLKKVTVFNDRAELRREFTVELKAGLNEVTIEAISQFTVDESVRVSGKGAAVIEEVQVAHRRITKGAVDTERGATLRKEKEELESAREKVDYDGQIVQKQITALDGLVSQVGSGPLAGIGNKFSADAATLESITSLFAFHKKQVSQLREEFRSLRKEFDRLTGLIAVKDQELPTVAKTGNWETTKNVIVLLEATEPTTVILDVSYHVARAGWTPFYDIRVETKEEKTEMQLSYYANVHQSTGEEWEGAQLLLSTARPFVGVTLPDLGTLDVSLYCRNREFHSFGPPASGGLFGSAQTSTTGVAFGSASSAVFGGSELAAAPMVAREAEVNEQTLSTEFSITRPCSIPADGAMHKVTIGIVVLTPQLVHESVPSKNSVAFLTATALNSSSLPLLAGPASVYLDGAFVAKTAIKAVSPGERFTASLGVDRAVKIEYKPAHKYHEQTGIINKWSSTVNEQKIVVKNTRGDAVLLTIREQIPRSTDEKIKVTMVLPEILEKVIDEDILNEDQRPKEGARLLPSHNLEWTVKLEKGSSQSLLVKYTVEHPLSEKLEYTQRFNPISAPFNFRN
ncbi:hypothetical protein PENTCL1PPCAC_624, partial [Pristionchus entomophagus]